MCYRTVPRYFNMCDPDFTNHKTDKFTEENDRDDGVVSITQPLVPNDFVLQK